MNDADRDAADQLVLALLAAKPRTWTELADAGLTRGAVFASVDRLTFTGKMIVAVGPLLLERLDLTEGGEGASC